MPGYTVLASSFKSREKAESLIEPLAMLDLGEEIQLAHVTVQSEPWYRITLGLFHDKKETRHFLNRIQMLPGIKPLVIPVLEEASSVLP